MTNSDEQVPAIPDAAPHMLFMAKVEAFIAGRTTSLDTRPAIYCVRARHQ